MIVYFGSIRKFEHFNIETVFQNVPNDIDTIGFWLTSDLQSAKPYAMGSETVVKKSVTEFWDDGEPKVVQFDKSISGFIYKVYMDEPNLKEYESYSEDSYHLFMTERDQYCDYFGAKKSSWKDQSILLNKEKANTAFRNNLMKKGYEGMVIRNTKLHSGVTDLYCIFSAASLHIADVMPVNVLDDKW